MLRFILPLKRWLSFSLFFLILVYLIFHLIEGELGLRSWRHLERHKRYLHHHVLQTEKKESRLRKRVDLLKGHIDCDLLEEQVFRHLGYIRPDDVVLFDATPDAHHLLPLAVDFDGTLIQEETHIVFLQYAVLRSPLLFFRAFYCLLSEGVASCKHFLAHAVLLKIKPSWTVRPALMDWLWQEKKQGRRLILITGAPYCVVQSMPAILNVFDDVLTSSDSKNLVGVQKLARLNILFGEKRFDYVGNSWKDRHIWRGCHQSYIVTQSRWLKRWAVRKLCRPLFWQRHEWQDYKNLC